MDEAENDSFFFFNHHHTIQHLIIFLLYEFYTTSDTSNLSAIALQVSHLNLKLQNTNDKAGYAYHCTLMQAQPKL